MKAPVAALVGLVGGLGVGIALGHWWSQPGGVFSGVTDGKERQGDGERGRQEEGKRERGKETAKGSGQAVENAAPSAFPQGPTVQAPVFDRSAKSLARILEEGGVPREFAAFLVGQWLSAQARGGGDQNWEDSGQRMREALGEIFGEEGEWLSTLVQSRDFITMFGEGSILTFEEQAKALAIQREIAQEIREARTQGEVDEEALAMMGWELWQKKLASLLGEDRYADYRLATDQPQVLKAAEQAGVPREQMREWVKIQDEFNQRIESVLQTMTMGSDPEEIERLFAQAQAEQEEKQRNLLGARYDDFVKFGDPHYWGLKEIGFSENPAELDQIYKAARPWFIKIDAVDREDREGQESLRRMALEDLSRRFPAVDPELWYGIF